MRKRLFSIVLCMALLLSLIPNITAQAGTYSLLWPTPGNVGVTACYSHNGGHGAIDIAAPKGAPVIASASGYVTSLSTACTHNYGKSTSCCSSTGNYVRIRSSNTINGQTVEIRYCHLTDIYVSVGQYVNAGDTIGTVGSTGYSTGNHLDFKMFLNGNTADPGPYLQIPSDLYYAGSKWYCCGPYMQQLMGYNNGTYDPGSQGSSLRLQAGYTYPILLLQGKNFSVSGTVSSNTAISSLTARIIKPDGSVSQSKTVSPNATSYNLSNLASSLNFSRLSEGYYIYEILAKDKNTSSNVRLLYSPFTVSKNATMAAMFGYTYPTSLKPGQSFSLKGTIVSINSLSSVSVKVVSTGGSVLINETRHPNSTTFDLSSVDSSVKFSSLPEGAYYYQVTGTDTAGNTSTVIDRKFYVTNKTGIVGEIDIRIDGWLQAPSVGKTMRANIEAEPSGAQYSIQWYADGQAISGATGTSFTPAFAHKGKKISVTISGTGDYIGELESAETDKVINMGDILGDQKFSLDLVSMTVSPAPAGTSVKALMDGLITDFLFTGIYDKTGKALSDDDILATGYELKSVVLGITVLRYYIVVQGDVSGTGSVSASDARRALRASSKLETLSKAGAAAADIDRDGNLTATDARTILRVSSKLASFPEII